MCDVFACVCWGVRHEQASDGSSTDGVHALIENRHAEETSMQPLLPAQALADLIDGCFVPPCCVNAAAGALWVAAGVCHAHAG